jgi:predicted GIY-YIG superfamily endonuclease
VDDHNSGKSKYTRGKGPWVLIFHIKLDSRSEAMKLERKTKILRGLPPKILYPYFEFAS